MGRVVRSPRAYLRGALDRLDVSRLLARRLTRLVQDGHIGILIDNSSRWDTNIWNQNILAWANMSKIEQGLKKNDNRVVKSEIKSETRNMQYSSLRFGPK